MLGLTAEKIVRHSPKPRYIGVGEGEEEPDREKLQELLAKPSFKVLLERWVVECTFQKDEQGLQTAAGAPRAHPLWKML